MTPQENEPTVVQKVAQSVGSKVAAGAIPLLTTLLSFLGDLPPYPRAGVMVAGFLIGGLLWDRSKQRQFQLQVELVKAGSSKMTNTVEIAPPSAKVG